MEEFSSFVKRARDTQKESENIGSYHVGDQANSILTTVANTRPWKSTNYVDQIDRQSIVFTRSAANHTSFFETQKVHDTSTVDILNITHLNYLLHSLAYKYNSPRKDADVNNDAELEKLWKYAKTWTVRGVCLTPASDLNDLPVDKSRDITIQVRGSVQVNNLWGGGVKNGDTCYIVLKLAKCNRHEQTVYTFSRMDSQSIQACQLNYDYPKFFAVFHSNPNVDLLSTDSEYKTPELPFIGMNAIYHQVGIACNNAMNNRTYSKYGEEENDDLTSSVSNPQLVLMMN